MSIRALFAVALLAPVPAVAGAWGNAPKPPDTVVVSIGSGSIEVWPYTGTDFSGTRSDPVNLFFLDTDPRAIRQALLALDGNRPPDRDLPPPFGGCVWIDGMGYEQTGWADEDGWVGSEIQLVCTHPDTPLGGPFRVHVRLFRQGQDTIGAAHFEFLIPDTAEHEVLSWDFARLFVIGDIARTDLPIGFPSEVPLVHPGYFRSVRMPVYQGLIAQGAAPLLSALGLSADVVDETGNPRIPTSGAAVAVPLRRDYEPMRERIQTRLTVDYAVVAPRPFCSTGPYDLVLLQGPVHFALTVSTDAAGRYLRRYRVDGELTVTPWDPVNNLPAGDPAPARVRERHAALLTDRYGQVYERTSQELLGDAGQSLSWSLAAGEIDKYHIDVQCGP